MGERAGLGPQADAVGQRDTLVDALEDRGLGVGGPSRDDEVVGAVAVGGVAVLALDGHAGGRVPDGRKDQEVQGAVELIDVLVLDDPGETVAVAVLVSDAVVCLQLALGRKRQLLALGDEEQRLLGQQAVEVALPVLKV